MVKRIIVDVVLPDNFNEGIVDNAISNAIFSVNGEVLDIKNYEDIDDSELNI